MKITFEIHNEKTALRLWNFLMQQKFWFDNQKERYIGERIRVTTVNSPIPTMSKEDIDHILDTCNATIEYSEDMSNILNDVAENILKQIRTGGSHDHQRKAAPYEGNQGHQ